MKVLEFSIIVHQAEEGGYWVEVPALEGCFTQGETIREVLKNAKEAIELHLEGWDEFEEEIPRDHLVMAKKVKVNIKTDASGELSHFLQSGKGTIKASEAEKRVPDQVGIYSIIIDHSRNLPTLYKKYQMAKKHNVIYLGKAERTLFKRLVEEDLRHKRASTFFRSIGAILGHRPPKGSLKGKKNQNNFKFSEKDTQKIINWINRHISVKYRILDPAEIQRLEKICIKKIKPLLNLKNNPKRLVELENLRNKCRKIAQF